MTGTRCFPAARCFIEPSPHQQDVYSLYFQYVQQLGMRVLLVAEGFARRIGLPLFSVRDGEEETGGNKGEGGKPVYFEMGDGKCTRRLRPVPPHSAFITLFRLSFFENLPCFHLTFRRVRHHLTQDMAVCEWKRAGDGGRETPEGWGWGGKDEREWL